MLARSKIQHKILEQMNKYMGNSRDFSTFEGGTVRTWSRALKLSKHRANSGIFKDKKVGPRAGRASQK